MATNEVKNNITFRKRILNISETKKTVGFC
jgi:hypothetical protein